MVANPGVSGVETTNPGVSGVETTNPGICCGFTTKPGYLLWIHYQTRVSVVPDSQTRVSVVPDSQTRVTVAEQWVTVAEQWVTVAEQWVTVGSGGPGPVPRGTTRVRTTTATPITPVPHYPGTHLVMSLHCTSTRPDAVVTPQECQFSRKWCQRGAWNNGCLRINGDRIHARRDCQGTKPGSTVGLGTKPGSTV